MFEHVLMILHLLTSTNVNFTIAPVHKIWLEETADDLCHLQKNIYLLDLLLLWHETKIYYW